MDNKKRCCHCKEIKLTSEFHKSKSRKDGYNSECKLCFHQRYLLKHPNANRSIPGRWKNMVNKYCPGCKQTKLVEDFNKHKRQWDGYAPYCKSCRTIRQNANPMLKFSRQISTTIAACLRKKGGSKHGQKTWDLLGYTFGELKIHLESQFVDGMSWNNRGRNGWQIDHIRPISSFEFTSPDDIEFKICWSLHNLQPLWAADNLSKSNKLNWVA